MPKAVRFENIEVVAGGGTDTILSTSFTEKIVLSTSGAIVMAGNYNLTHDGSWAEGSELDVTWTGVATLGAFNITLYGYPLTQAQATAGNLKGTAYAKSGSVIFTPNLTSGSAQVGTADMTDEAITVGKMADLARGSIIVGGASNRPVALDIKTAGAIPIGDGTDVAAHTVTGDITMNSGGVTAIGAGVIVNADISSTALVAVSKLEAMTNGQVITGLTGAPSIPVIRTLSADATIANTGALTVAANSITPEKSTVNLTDDEINVDVSFAAGSVGGFFTTIAPCNGTILEVNGTVTFLIEASNNGTVTPNISGTPVTGGLVTFTAGDALNQDRTGTAVTANANFTTGQEINLVTAKVTAGGTARMTIKYRKTS